MPQLGEAGPEVVPLVSDEELLQKRSDLHDELGTLSLQLSEITRQYNDCIQNMILTNDEIRRRHLSTAELERQTTYSHVPEAAEEPYDFPVVANL